MTDAIALLAAPLAAALCLTGIHAYFGIQVLRRNVIFVDLALAQIAAFGATVAFVLGHPAMGAASYGYSLAFTLLAALLLSFTRRWSERIPQEALIGVIYVVAAAAALLMIDRAPQGAEHLKQVLTGNLLTASWDDISLIAPLYLAVAFAHWLMRARLLAAVESDWRWDFVFYATFGVVVTSSVALAGVLLVFSFLIVPAAIGVLYAERLMYQLVIAWISGAAASVIGLAASYAWDLPTGAAMVCAFGVVLAAAGLTHPFARRGSRAMAAPRLVAALRWSASIALLISSVWLIAVPRADQPLFEIAESAVPSLRGLYLNAREADVYRDASAHAERYRGEIERLNEREARSRFEGRALDDEQLRRVSSFLKSFHEMLRGEEFVMREVTIRARARMRWIAGAIGIAIALSIAPGFFSAARGLLGRTRERRAAGKERS